MSTHNMCFLGEIRKISCGYPLLSVTMLVGRPIPAPYQYSGNPSLMSGIWHCDQSLSYSRQSQYIGRPSFEIGQTSQNRMGFGSIGDEFHFPMLSYPNVGLFASRFSHKLPLYVSPILDNHALARDALSVNWNHLHAYAFPPTILIPSVLVKIRQSQCRIVLIAPLGLNVHGSQRCYNY